MCEQQTKADTHNGPTNASDALDGGDNTRASQVHGRPANVIALLPFDRPRALIALLLLAVGWLTFATARIMARWLVSPNSPCAH